MDALNLELSPASTTMLMLALGGILKNYDWNYQAALNEDDSLTFQLGLIAQEVDGSLAFIHRTPSHQLISQQSLAH